MGKTTYKVAFPFSNGDYYIEVREGKRFIKWLTVGDVPAEVRHLIVAKDGKWESVRCKAKKEAQLLVEHMRRLAK